MTLALALPRVGRPLTSIFLHDLGVGILAEVELGHAQQRLAILGQQEIVSLLLVAAIEGDGQGVVIGEIAGLDRSQNHFYPGGNGIENPHLLLDSPGHFRGHRLGGATQAYDQKHKCGTPQKRH